MAQRKNRKPKKPSPASAKGPFNSNYVREPDRIADPMTGKTLLIAAIEKEDLPLVKKLLKAGASPNKPAKDGRAPLHFAAGRGFSEAIELLFEAGAQANPRDKQLRTPFFEALEGQVPHKILRQLVKGGGDVNIPSADGCIPLHIAAEKSAPGLLRWLTGKTRNPDHPDKKGVTPLHRAAGAGSVGAIEALLFERISFFIADNEGETVLHAAAGRKDDKGAAAFCLLSSDAVALVGAVDINGRTPLHHAIRAGNTALVKKLIELGADLNRPDKDGVTPVVEAVLANSIDAAKLLIGDGADVRRPAQAKCPPALILAIRNHGNAKMVELLLSENADAREKDSDGQTALMCAAARNNPALIASLLAAGADAATVDESGRNALHHAGGLLPRETLKALVDGGADINAQDSSTKRTPLVNALWDRKSMMAQILLDLGADVKMADSHGLTPLHLAVRHDEPDLVTKFLDRGADPNAAENYNERTPLHLAAGMGMGAEVKKLLDRGADPNAKDFVGRTPLHATLFNGLSSLEAIKHLLDKGADPLAEDKQGTTPYDLAAFNGGRRTVQEIFRLHLASKGKGPYRPKRPPAPPWWGMA